MSNDSTRNAYGVNTGRTKSQAADPIINDQQRRENYMITNGSRRLCAAILAAGKTHGPCDAVRAIAYATNQQIIG